MSADSEDQIVGRRDASAIRWKQNALRHSFGSYRSELKKDLLAVSREMGNSPQVIRNHYFSQVMPQDAVPSFEIFPETGPQGIAQAA